MPTSPVAPSIISRGASCPSGRQMLMDSRRSVGIGALDALLYRVTLCRARELRAICRRRGEPAPRAGAEARLPPLALAFALAPMVASSNNLSFVRSSGAVGSGTTLASIERGLSPALPRAASSAAAARFFLRRLRAPVERPTVASTTAAAAGWSAGPAT